MTFQQLSLFKSSDPEYSGQQGLSLNKKGGDPVRLYDVGERGETEELLKNAIRKRKTGVLEKREHKKIIKKNENTYLATQYLENLQEKIVDEGGEQDDQYEEFICPPRFPLGNLEKALFSPVDCKADDDPSTGHHKGFLPLFYIYGESGVGKSHLLWKWFFALKQFEKQFLSHKTSRAIKAPVSPSIKILWLEKLSPSFIEEMLEYLTLKNMRLYVFIDDLNEKLAQTDQLHVFCQLVDLSLRHRNQLSYIAAGPCPIVELSKIFTLDKLSARLSLFSDYPLKPLDKVGEEQFVRWQGKKLGLSDEAVSIILQNERQKSLIRPFNGFFWQGILHRYLWEDSLPRPASAQQLCLWDQSSVPVIEKQSSSVVSEQKKQLLEVRGSAQELSHLIPSVTIPSGKQSYGQHNGPKDTMEVVVERYQKMICQLFEITKEALCSRQRLPHVVLARHLFVYALYQTGQVNRHQLAKKIGMDHSSVLYILSKVQDALRIKGHPLQLWYEKFLILHRR